MLKNARSKAESKSAKKTKGKKSRAKTAPETAPVIDTKPEAAAATGEKAPKNRKKAERKDGKMSGLDAAAQVLKEAGTPLNAKEMLERMLASGLWNTSGKTPQATIYAAIIREIAQKGDASRFKKTERGHFAAK